MCIAHLPSVLELSLLGLQSLLDVVIVAVVDLLVLDGSHVVVVHLWQSLFMSDRLDGGVMVILVDFTVDDLLGLLVMSTSDMLVLNCWVHSLCNVRHVW